MPTDFPNVMQRVSEDQVSSNATDTFTFGIGNIYDGYKSNDNNGFETKHDAEVINIIVNLKAKHTVSKVQIIWDPLYHLAPTVD